MDTFFEQIVPVKKDSKSLLAALGIWAAAVLLSGILLLVVMNFPGYLTLIFLVIFGLFYGAYKLTRRFNVEYEYIITNGVVDIDKIMSKSSRKRLLTFELSDVTVLEKFDPNKQKTGNYKTSLIACNPGDPAAFEMVASKENGGSVYIVMAPDDRMKQAMLKYIPRHISNQFMREI